MNDFVRPPHSVLQRSMGGEWNKKLSLCWLVELLFSVFLFGPRSLFVSELLNFRFHIFNTPLLYLRRAITYTETQRIGQY